MKYRIMIPSTGIPVRHENLAWVTDRLFKTYKEAKHQLALSGLRRYLLVKVLDVKVND